MENELEGNETRGTETIAVVNECNDSDYKNNKAGCVTGSRDRVGGMDLKHTM